MEKRKGRGEEKKSKAVFSHSHTVPYGWTHLTAFFLLSFPARFRSAEKESFRFPLSLSRTHCHLLSGTTATKGDNKYRVLCEREMGPSLLLLQAAAAFATADCRGPSAGRAIV